MALRRLWPAVARGVRWLTDAAAADGSAKAAGASAAKDSGKHSVAVSDFTEPLGFTYFIVKPQQPLRLGLPTVFVRHAEPLDAPPPLQRPLLDGVPGGMFAVIMRGHKQYKVTQGDVLYMDRLRGDVNETVVFDSVLCLGTPAWSAIGRPLVEGARVRTIIEEQGKSGKIINFKMKRRKGYRRTKGHRQLYTRLQVQDIEWSVPDDEQLEPLRIGEEGELPDTPPALPDLTKW
ncbi:hypothetical protein CDCA_CDCA17G4434 [Cyanidium caldarium]|uniref:Large ribosomal subunit protein bL21m n=1 Tax=Cyanidium caldarium TaxID=2771 RepID=A0AAV9J1N8_CYACA|nr:hypothetical protein CDCA_CDCA17G4434 [Cyanidium caldarium]